MYFFDFWFHFRFQKFAIIIGLQTIQSCSSHQDLIPYEIKNTNQFMFFKLGIPQPNYHPQCAAAIVRESWEKGMDVDGWALRDQMIAPFFCDYIRTRLAAALPTYFVYHIQWTKVLYFL